MEHCADMMLQEHPQPPQPNKYIPYLPKNTVVVLGFFNIVCLKYLIQAQNPWKVSCFFWLYVYSVLLLISNGKIQDFSVNRPGEVQKWRRLCTLLLCLLAAELPASIYCDHMEHWFKISIFVGSGILIVIILVLHDSIEELSKLKANSVAEPNFIDSIMYYNILNTMPFCAIFTFCMMGDPWSLWCDALICTDIVLVAVCNSKAVVSHRRAEFMKWRRAACFGLAMLPALVMMYQEALLHESYKKVSWIMNGSVVLFVVLVHIVDYEMKTGKEDGESEKDSA